MGRTCLTAAFAILLLAPLASGVWPASLEPADGLKAAGTTTGSSLVHSQEATAVPAFIDAFEGVAPENGTWDPNPLNWPTRASISQRGSLTGETEAKLRLWMEGRGERVRGYYIQTVIVLDNSIDGASSDPPGNRCAGIKEMMRNWAAPEEAALVMMTSAATLLQVLTTDGQAISDRTNCDNPSGGAAVSDALRLSLDELVPKKDPGLRGTVLLVSAGKVSGPDPQAQVARAARENVSIFPVCPGALVSCDVTSMRNWANQTGGKFVHAPTNVYSDTYYAMVLHDLAGKPPTSGASMVRLRLAPDIEVVPGSIACDAPLCTNPTPDAPSQILPGNRGLLLEWHKPVAQIMLGERWGVSLLVRAYVAGKGVPVDMVMESFIEYDRGDGSQGGSDRLRLLDLDVSPDPCAVSCLSSVAIDPPTANLLAGASQQFTATARDQHGAAMSNVSFTWGVNGTMGTVDPSGLFSGTAVGAGSVWVEGTLDNITKRATASVTVTPDDRDRYPPFVVSTLPSQGDVDVFPLAQVEIKWNESMDTASAQAAFSSTPPMSCSWSWPTADRQTCAPSQLMLSTTYEVTILSTAKDLAGNGMLQPFAFSFTTRSSAQVPPKITHTPKAEIEEGTALVIRATVTDDISVNEVTVHYAASGATSFKTLAMTGVSGDTFEATIPGSEVIPEKIEYYIKAVDDAGNEASSPTVGALHSVSVTRKAPPPPPPPTPGPGGVPQSLIWILVAVIVALAALVALAIVLTRRRQRTRLGQYPHPEWPRQPPPPGS